jgi:hypothetical protein
MDEYELRLQAICRIRDPQKRIEELSRLWTEATQDYHSCTPGFLKELQAVSQSTWRDIRSARARGQKPQPRPKGPGIQGCLQFAVTDRMMGGYE